MTKTIDGQRLKMSFALALAAMFMGVALYAASKPLIVGILGVPDSGLTAAISLVVCTLPPLFGVVRFFEYRARLQRLENAEAAAKTAAQGTSEQQG